VELDEVQLNGAGKIARDCWLEIPIHYPNVILHEFVIMPNHVHGIIELKAPSAGSNNHMPDNANKDAPEIGRHPVVGANNHSPDITRWNTHHSGVNERSMTKSTSVNSGENILRANNHSPDITRWNTHHSDVNERSMTKSTPVNSGGNILLANDYSPLRSP